MTLSKRILDRVETLAVIRTGEVKPTLLEKMTIMRKHPAAPDAPGMPIDTGIRNLRKRERQQRRKRHA